MTEAGIAADGGPNHTLCFIGCGLLIFNSFKPKLRKTVVFYLTKAVSS